MLTFYRQQKRPIERTFMFLLIAFAVAAIFVPNVWLILGASTAGTLYFVTGIPDFSINQTEGEAI